MFHLLLPFIGIISMALMIFLAFLLVIALAAIVAQLFLVRLPWKWAGLLLPVLSLCTYSLAGLVFFVFDLLALELIRGFVVLLIWNAPTIILLLERRWVPVLRQQRMARKAAAQAPRQF